MYSLFLDDERTPKTKAPYGEWVVCRSFDIAIEYIMDTMEYPMYISFDHDLGENQKTGYDFVKWFVDDWDSFRATKTVESFPECNYHTANPVGRDNMKAYIDNYLKQLISEATK